MVSPQAVLKVLARLKYSVPLYKAKSEFLILAEECLTFETVTSCLAQRLRSFPHAPCLLGLLEYFKGALQTAVYTVFSALLFSGM